jgi:chromosome segregation ATPase
VSEAERDGPQPEEQASPTPSESIELRRRIHLVAEHTRALASERHAIETVVNGIRGDLSSLVNRTESVLASCRDLEEELGTRAKRTSELARQIQQSHRLATEIEEECEALRHRIGRLSMLGQRLERQLKSERKDLAQAKEEMARIRRSMRRTATTMDLGDTSEEPQWLAGREK